MDTRQCSVEKYGRPPVIKTQETKYIGGPTFLPKSSKKSFLPNEKNKWAKNKNISVKFEQISPNFWAE